MTAELEIIEHHGEDDVPHFHVQWVEDGDRALVPAVGCIAYATREEAERARNEALEEHAAYLAALQRLAEAES